MNTWKAIGGAVLALAACWMVADLSVAAPEPSIGVGEWQLDISFYDPQRITVQLPGEEEPTTYWYFLFRVVNRTGEDVQFYPSFELVTNTLKVVEGGAKIHPDVYDAIAARHKVEFPFFAAPAKVSGLLLQGEENGRTSAAVFRAIDPKADHFTVYTAGLSGEVQRVPNPGFDPDRPEGKENPQFFLLRKTLAVHYDLPGDPKTHAESVPVRRDREWVMR
jgi:hypothetical protein